MLFSELRTCEDLEKRFRLDNNRGNMSPAHVQWPICSEGEEWLLFDIKDELMQQFLKYRKHSVIHV